MKKLIRSILSILQVTYIIVALSFTSKWAASEKCRGIRIAVNDSIELRFVTSSELGKELGDLPSRIKGMRMTDISTDSIEAFLNSIDKIEHASVVKLTDGFIHITVDPMHPVARVFDTNESYYINHYGKRISADARYHVDVPLIQGTFNDSIFSARELLPLAEYINNDSLLNPLISMIKVESPSDVLLIPIIRGQVINIGEPRDLDDKFARLKRMYHEVLPVKGWDYYDTLSVKWHGQIVATRRHKNLPENRLITEEGEEQVDINTMLTADGVAPGQTMPGRKAKNDKQIPTQETKKQQTQG